MAIGTSLGAYFESDFNHQAGIDTRDENGIDVSTRTKDQNEFTDEGIKHDDTPIPVSDKYDTPLKSEEGNTFKDWKQKNAPNDTGEDYDLQGAYKAGLTASDNGHLPDTYKKPNHPTFSDESIYHGQDGEQGGHWGIKDGKDTFTPGLSNLEHRSMGELRDYFSKVEKDATLNTPDIGDVSTAARMAVEASRKAVDALKRAQGTLPTSDADTGIEGKVYMKSPYGTITDEDIDKGMSLGMGFAGGGFHATLDGLGLLSRLGGKISTSADGIPATVHLQGEGHAALQEGPDVFQQFMASRGSRQPSNIGDDWSPAAIERRAQPTNDIINRSRYPEQDARMGFTSEQSRALDSRSTHDFEQHPLPPEQHGFNEADLMDQHAMEQFHEERVSINQRNINDVKQKFVDNPDVVKKGDISLLKDQGFSGQPGLHHFNFLSEDGVPGDLTLRLKQGGKELYVTWMGKVGGGGPNEVGRSEMKNLFRLLADQYPEAREISGFRVSGARSAVGRMGDASMKIPGRGK